MSNDDHRQHPNDLTTWPDDAMSFWLSGYLEGIERGRELENADVARLHSIAYRTVQAAARLNPYAVQQAAVKVRQAASSEHQRQEARHWPDEATS